MRKIRLAACILAVVALAAPVQADNPPRTGIPEVDDYVDEVMASVLCSGDNAWVAFGGGTHPTEVPLGIGDYVTFKDKYDGTSAIALFAYTDPGEPGQGDDRFIYWFAGNIVIDTTKDECADTINQFEYSTAFQQT